MVLILAGVFFVSLLGIAVPNFIRARNFKASNACVSNLRMIDGAKEQWALEHHKATNDPVSWADVQPYMGRGPEGEIPICPEGGIYVLNRIGVTPRCSIGGPGHSLDYDFSTENAFYEVYGVVILLLGALSGIGLIGTIFVTDPVSFCRRCKSGIVNRKGVTWISLGLLLALILALALYRKTHNAS